MPLHDDSGGLRLNLGVMQQQSHSSMTPLRLSRPHPLAGSFGAARFHESVHWQGIVRLTLGFVSVGSAVSLGIWFFLGGPERTIVASVFALIAGLCLLFRLFNSLDSPHWIQFCDRFSYRNRRGVHDVVWTDVMSIRFVHEEQIDDVVGKIVATTTLVITLATGETVCWETGDWYKIEGPAKMTEKGNVHQGEQGGIERFDIEEEFFARIVQTLVQGLRCDDSETRRCACAHPSFDTAFVARETGVSPRISRRRYF